MSEELEEQEVARALIRLLRALNDNQAHGKEDVTVFIGTAEQQAAGIVSDSPRYKKVMALAQESRALVPDEEAAEPYGHAAGDIEPYKFTSAALSLLRRADELGV